MSVVTLPVMADEPSNAAMKAEIEVLKDRLARLEGKLTRGGEAPAAVQPAAEIPEPVWPVPGIYTVPDTKDLGKLTGISWLSGTKIRGWVDTNYVVNFNGPKRSVVDANQGSSVVKGRDVSVEGRTFDIHDQSLSLSLAEVELEKVPEMGGVGFKFDMAFGETQDIIADTIRGSLTGAVGDTVTDFDKTFQHASLSYLAPIGRGLRFDAGKFVTHIGGETIETVKNWNYSHSFFYTYAIPFQDTGLHVSYPWSDTLYTDFYFLNGWNSTIEQNKGKSLGSSIGWTPVPWLSLVTNYLVGPERAGSGDLRHLWDSQVMLGPFNGWNFMVNTDLGVDDNARVATVTTRGTQKATWGGVTGYARYKINDWLEPSVRLEWFNDHHGFQTGVGQDLLGLTFTLNTKLGLGKSKGSVVMIRPEIRYDHSNEKFFTNGGKFRNGRDQTTVGVGVSWLF